MPDPYPPADGDDPTFEMECWSCKEPFPFRKSDVSILFIKAVTAARPANVQCPHCKAWNRMDLGDLDPPGPGESPPGAP